MYIHSLITIFINIYIQYKEGERDRTSKDEVIKKKKESQNKHYHRS